MSHPSLLRAISTGTESDGICLISTGDPLGVNVKHSASLRWCSSNLYFTIDPEISRTISYLENSAPDLVLVPPHMSLLLRCEEIYRTTTCKFLIHVWTHFCLILLRHITEKCPAISVAGRLLAYVSTIVLVPWELI